MKNLFIAILVILLFVPTSLAFSQFVELGFKIGPNIGFISGEDFSDAIIAIDDQGEDVTRVRLGVTAGFFLSIGVHEFLAVQTELMFSNVGGSYEYDAAALSPNAITGEINVTVLELPILLKPRFILGGGVMYFLLGPEITVVLGLVRERVVMDDDVTASAMVPDNDMIISLVAGLGYAYPIGPGLAVAEVRYHRSMTKIWDDVDYTLNAIQILFGYELILGASEQ